MKKRLLAALFGTTVLLSLLAGCGGSASSSSQPAPAPAETSSEAPAPVESTAPVEAPTPEPEEPEEEEPEEEAPAPSGTLTLGDTFVFDEIELTLGTEIYWDTVQNRFSDLNGQDVFYIDVTLRNLADDTHKLNRFNFTQFGSKGSKLDGVSAYFNDPIDSSGDIRSGGEFEGYLYFLYDGDGAYYIEFEKRGQDKIEVMIPVTK